MSVATLALLIVFSLLLLSTTPIAVALGLSSFLYFFFFTTIGLTQVPAALFNALESFPLVAVPLFIFAANIMTAGGIARRLTDAAKAAMGQFPGGLAMAAVVSCMFFAAISGSSSATVVAVGTLLIPAMAKAGYGQRYSTGLIATSGSMGILIPPSIPLIVYGTSTEQNIGELFIAGVIPGILAGLLLLALVIFLARGRNLGNGEAALTEGDKVRTFKDAFLSLLLPIIILGGIYQGVFTPTEAAGVAVIYALLISLLVYREIGLRDLPGITMRSAKMSAMIMFVIANGTLLSFVLTSEQIPVQVTNLFISLDLGRWSFLLVVILLLLIVGCFMETSSAILILAPILLPVALALGVDPIHFGIIVVMALEIGLVTPPLGLNLFVASGISGIPILQVAWAAIPSALVLLGALLIVTYIPDLALALLDR